MGLFDDLKSEYPLPDSPPEAQSLTFQTKSLWNSLDYYVIQADGQLVQEQWDYEEVPGDPDSRIALDRLPRNHRIEGSQRWLPVEFDGAIRFYGDTKPPGAYVYDPDTKKLMQWDRETGERTPVEYEEYEYVAWFENGKLFKIKRVDPT